MGDWSNDLTTAGNLLFVVSALFGILALEYILRRDTMADTTTLVVRAWQIKDTAIFLRVAWWVVAIITSDANAINPTCVSTTYNCFFVEYKHFITIPSSLLYVYGQFLFIQHVTNMSNWCRTLLMGFAVMIAGGITWVGF